MKAVKETFELASKTGEKILILRAIGNCDCYDAGDLIESEPLPSCPKCKGTGQIKFKVMSEKIRMDNSPSEEVEEINLTGNEKAVFYFPENYSYLNTKDMLATVVDGNKDNIRSYYDIVSIERLHADGFTYFEVTATKENLGV